MDASGPGPALSVVRSPLGTENFRVVDRIKGRRGGGPRGRVKDSWLFLGKAGIAAPPRTRMATYRKQS